MPLLLAIPGLSVTDAYFEAMSGFTATGATVLAGLDALPLSVNVWRCFLMWVGGLGIIVLAVAILPLLGVGGSAAVQGRDGRPDEGRQADAAHRRDRARTCGWCISGCSSLACFVAYALAGMSWADAFMHMCTTVGLGGFSSHDASFGYWNSPLIEAVAVVFMLLPASAWRCTSSPGAQRSLRVLWRNTEARAFVLVLAAAIALIVGLPGGHGSYDSLSRCAAPHRLPRGLGRPPPPATPRSDYAAWPLFAPVLMICSAASPPAPAPPAGASRWCA